MLLRHLELQGFKSFAKKTNLEFDNRIICIVGPNGSGKSNVVEAFRFVLGEQSMKSMRGKGGIDLIFKGSKVLPKSSFAKVTIYFDNKDRFFKLINENGENTDLNYDIVSIGREVYADGVNKYTLNGSEVRLKDINNLLSSVSIGSSGHHIISQGEADRILNSSLKERREMIEDALGLRVYQFKIKEANKKLERTTENMKEVSMLRRENIPHLNFLKKQVEKLQKLEEMRNSLKDLYKEYLKKESFYLDKEKEVLMEKREALQLEKDNISRITKERYENEQVSPSEKLEELKNLESKISEIRRVKSEFERKLGRVEGMIEGEKVRAEREPAALPVDPEKLRLTIEEVESFVNDALSKESLEEVRGILLNIKSIFVKLKDGSSENPKDKSEREIALLLKTQEDILLEMQKIETEENTILQSIAEIKKDINKEIEEGRDKEREKYELKVKEQELTSALELNGVHLENLEKSFEAFSNEITEGRVLIGESIDLYQNFEFDGQVDRIAQEELKREIERIKIRLEDSGVGDQAEILKEYEEVKERDEFLSKELEDLNQSILSLNQIIADLKIKISEEFDSGVNKINVEFNRFFGLMFGGGKAKLDLVEVIGRRTKSESSPDEEEYSEETDEEEKETEIGVDIDVALPNKRVKELHSLSGGERSLTSIALLFAMSSVNPPPFLVLDETDAALDEANSRKYGDMLERLSQFSQLVVVTHNRETMSRANILYGVTIGSDESSKLLSVKFDEAVSIAK